MVDIERAADETDRRGAGAMRAKPADPGLDDLRMIGQPEIVVRAQHDHLATIDRCGRSHRAGDRPQLLVLAGLRAAPVIALCRATRASWRSRSSRSYAVIRLARRGRDT